MKKKLLVLTLVLIMSLSLTLAAFGCDTLADKNKNTTICTQHEFDDDGVCVVCGAWDGESNPTVKGIDSYCDRYVKNLKADSYPDFASTYDFDFEKDPELIDQGLFWTWYDSKHNIVREVSIRDKGEVDKLIADGRISASKPTIIFIHGICVDQYTRTIVEFEDETIELYSDGYGLLTNDTTVDPTLPEFAPYVDYTGHVNLNLIYLTKGYNVLNFVYTRFADEVMIKKTEVSDDGVERSLTFANNGTIESKVYSTEGKAGMRYRKSDGNFSDGTNISGELVAEVHEDVKFSIAEYFAAEYVRMFKYMVEKGVFTKDTHMGLAGHSMGGVVTTIGTFLLTELARVGQIPQWYLPDRIALQDSYFGVYSDYGENIPKYSELSKKGQTSLNGVRMMLVYNIKVHWSDKLIDGAGSAPLYLAALRQVVEEYGIAAEYYVDESGFGNGGVNYAARPATYINQLVRHYTSTIAYVLKFQKSFNSHNGIRECHVTSLLYDPYPDVDGNPTVSASASDEQIKAAKGKQWYLYKGNTTSTHNDDVVKAFDGGSVPNDFGK